MLEKSQEVTIMVFTIFKKSRGTQEQLDIQEAFNLWNALRVRYNSIETVQLYKNFTHDQDFNLLLSKFIITWNGQGKRYETLAEKLRVKVPKKPPRDFKSSFKLNEFTDDLIFRRIFNDMTAELYFLATAYRSSTTNDGVRQIIRQDLKSHLDDFELLYKYGKLKGYMDEPPAYKTAKPVKNEPLAVSEAFHILDHIGQRYHQLQLTRLFLTFAHDMEFRVILQQGVAALLKQTKTLEDLALKYEVPLPKQPPSSISVRIEPEAIEDRFIYLSILNGIQNAIDLHIRAVVETIRNDSLRKIVYDLFIDEIDLHESFVKYGKVKGWISTVPIYGEPI
jgi:hypothetical protein